MTDSDDKDQKGPNNQNESVPPTGEGEEKVIVKKVQPYPFPIVIASASKSFVGRVVKLVMHGFMVEVGPAVLSTGQSFDVSLQIPKFGQIITRAKVIKAYDRYLDVDGQKVPNRLVEMHFVKRPLPEEDQNKIKSFLEAIRQKGGGGFA